MADPAAELFYEGVRRMAQGDDAGAAQRFEDALRLAPAMAEAHANLGWLQARAGRAEAAEACYRRALQLAPGLAQVHLNLAALLLQPQRLAEAEAAYRAALALDDASPAAWTGLGVVLACARRDAEAEACHRRAIALAPDHRTAHFNLTYLLLRQGRWAEGWAALERREGSAALQERLGLPRWRGEALAGRRLLIGVEGGHGDMIQMLRYAALAKARGAARVGVLCQPALQRLFARAEAVDDAVALDDPAPRLDWDAWVPALSLPGLFGTQVDAVPAALPYLSAEPERIAHWGALLDERLGARAGRWRIGVVWHGNPAHENDAERSLPGLDLLAPLARLPGVQWLSLQHGSGEARAADAAALAASPVPLADVGALTGDLLDAAALLMNVDLLISIDSAYAHLAGALGQRCWLLLPDFKTDWRWLDGRRDSPWYPDVMRLFRQDATRRWTPVIEALAAELATLSRAAPAPRG